MSATGLSRSGDSAQAPDRAAPLTVETYVGPISISLTNDLPSLEARWTALQAIAPCTAAQTYSYAEAWARIVLVPRGKTPLVAVGSDAEGRDLFLWAFEIESAYGLKVLKWLGESHASYAMGLFRPEVAVRLVTRDARCLLDAIAERCGASAAFLCAQPYAWDGVPNPFAGLPHQSAPSDGYAVRLGDFSDIYRRRFSKRSRDKTLRKERRLRDIGRLDFGWVATGPDRLTVLDAVFEQKARQLAELGARNPFSPEVRAFYRELALLAGDDPARLRLGYLEVDGMIAATHSGTLCHNRLSICVSSLAAGDMQRYSPGGLLLRQQIEEACTQDLAYYDLGAGAGANKDEWCDIVQPLFDNFIAFNAQGLLLALPVAGLTALKRAIKSNRHLWPLMQRWRQALFGKTQAPSR